MRDEIRAAGQILAEGRVLTILTGAGISAESGVPTFRGKDGYWRNYRAEELATPQAFHSNPVLVWEWYSMRRDLLASIRPNPAHYAIAEMERLAVGFTLITQNVDGLHHLAGSRKVLEIHGNIWWVRCTECNRKEERREPFEELPPRCGCGGLLRPDVVWFGEMLPGDVLSESYSAVESCDVMLVVGTSGVVQPAATFPYLAKERGAKVIEVNPERTAISSIADVTIRGKAGEVVPAVLEVWKESLNPREGSGEDL